MNQQKDSTETNPAANNCVKSSANCFVNWLKGWGPVFLGAGVGAFLGIVAYIQHWIS
ncbi:MULTISPECIES: hypothetical protein [Bifidobacterium]|uniref:hypothetical protein n=1 Tax=Bifidobacterium TaxID=1678 RepID=UPI00168BEF71|nr:MULTISPECIES: hypothetical protein [Bifidobacterium]